MVSVGPIEPSIRASSARGMPLRRHWNTCGELPAAWTVKAALWPAARTRARVEELLELVGLDPAGYAGRYPAALSGGERQRVGVARALAADPPVMLMDEPFGAVDPIRRERLQNEFLRLQEKVRKTVVFVTHDVDEAIKMADRVAILNVGGILEQHAPPEEILRAPATGFVADFVGDERGLKRLGLIVLRDLEVEPGQAPAGAPSIEDGRTLREALDTLVTSGSSVAVVTGAGGERRGILTLERISRELAS